MPRYEVTTMIPIKVRFVADAPNPGVAEHRLEILRIDLDQHVRRWDPGHLGAIAEDLAYVPNVRPARIKAVKTDVEPVLTASVA